MIGVTLTSSLIWAGSFPSSSSDSSTPAPVLSSLNYDVVDSGGGDAVTITGTDLGSAISCTVDGSGVTITGNTDTTLTFTTPSIAAGTYNVQVTTAGGVSNTLTIEAFSVAALTPSLWCRAPYAGSPWASADASSLNLHHASPGTVGSTVNGYAPVDFNGTDQQLVSYNTAASATVNASSLVTTGAGTLLAFANVRTANAFASVQGQKAILTRQASNGFGMTYSSSGLRAYVYDGATKEPGSAIAFSTGAWHLFAMRWDGTNMYQSVDAGSEASVATSGPSTLNTPLVVGRGHTNTSAFYSDELVLEVVTAQTCFSTVNIGKIRKVLQCRYAQ